jgi:4-hydroxybenzoate polyprenyltransferase
MPTGATGRGSEALPRRFWTYLEERYPLTGFAPLIGAFTFSSAAYSRLARGAQGFVPWPVFAVGALTALVFFFLLRVLDEHKDADQDRRYRPELPVPRGLVTLAELRWMGGGSLVVVLALNALVAPMMLWTCGAVAVWAALMTKEFFVRDWLRAHAGAYLVTHMAIMPIIDAYTTGLDWLREGVHPPQGIYLFLVVTFLNGMVIEIGRKIRAPGGEREGVDTYTQAWGVRAAPIVWTLSLLGSAASAAWASSVTGHGRFAAPWLVLGTAAACFPALQFLRTRSAAWSKRIDVASQLWPLLTYLLLGTGPFVARWLRG